MQAITKEIKNTSPEDRKFLYSILLVVLLVHLGMLMCILI